MSDEVEDLRSKLAEVIEAHHESEKIRRGLVEALRLVQSEHGKSALLSSKALGVMEYVLREERAAKWETLEDYHQLREKYLGKGANVNEAVRDHVVVELRKLADHLESNKRPWLYVYNKKQFDKTLTETTICLSEPWGG